MKDNSESLNLEDNFSNQDHEMLVSPVDKSEEEGRKLSKYFPHYMKYVQTPDHSKNKCFFQPRQFSQKWNYIINSTKQSLAPHAFCVGEDEIDMSELKIASVENYIDEFATAGISEAIKITKNNSIQGLSRQDG